MRNLSRYLLLGLVLMLAFPDHLHAAQLGLYLERSDGLQLEKEKDYLGALVRFKVLLALLERIHETSPWWEHDLVLKDIADSCERIAALESPAAKQVHDKTTARLSSGQPVSMLYDEGLNKPDPWKAMNEIEEYLTTLEIMHRQDPQWEKELIEDRMKKSKALMDRLEAQALKALTEKPADGHTVQ